MPREAEAIHGLSEAFLADKPRFPEVVDEFLAFVGHSPLIAHNAMFDLGFINAELRAARRPPIFVERIVDTLQIARTRFPGAKHSLDALCTRFGIDRSMRVHHGALLDAQLLAAVYVELMGGRQIGFELESGEVAAVAASTATICHLPRPHAPSEAELARHAAFIATLKDPVWLTA